MAKRTSKSTKGQTSNLVKKLGGSEVAPSISDNLKGQVSNFQSKFNTINISNYVTGGSSNRQASVNYGNQSTVHSIAGKKVGTVTQIPQLSAPSTEAKGDETLLVYLSKMFSFMQQNREIDIKRKETEKSFEEENQSEEKRRHEQFLKVLKEYTTLKTMPTITAVPEKESSGGFFDGLWDTIKSMISSAIENVMKTVMELKNLITPLLNMAAKLGSFVGSNLFALLTTSAGLLAVTTVGALAALLFLGKAEKEEIEADPYAEKYKDNPYAMKLRGEATTIGQATVVNQNKALKQIPRRTVEEFVKSDFSDTELKQELGNDRPTLQKWLDDNPKRDAMYQAPVAAIAGQPQTAIPAGGLKYAGGGRGMLGGPTATEMQAHNVGGGRGTINPEMVTESTPTAEPVPPTPTTAAVNDVISKNADLVMEDSTSPGGSQPIIASSTSSSNSVEKEMPVSATQRDDTAIINRVFGRMRSGV